MEKAPFQTRLPAIVWLQLLVNETQLRGINSGRVLCPVNHPHMQGADAWVVAEDELTDLKLDYHRAQWHRRKTSCSDLLVER